MVPFPCFSGRDACPARFRRLAWRAAWFVSAVGVSIACGAGMVSIPGGTYVMGGKGGDRDETPAHAVTLSPFKLDKHEVTFAEYDSCVKRGRCTPAHYDDGRCLISVRGGFKRVRVPAKYRSPGRPVICVTWRQARAYCRQVGKRLPTEAEWEYAARAGKDRAYAWGNALPDAKRCTQPSHRSPRAAGSFAPNAWGLHDMTGNVWEWVADWYQRDYYALSKATNPRGPPVGQYRVVRGGGWYGGASHLRARNRQWLVPGASEVSIGFRCAR
jgi:formylglycine-generating enzyme required for sulfatase activity